MDLFTLSHYLALWGLISYCQQAVWEQNSKSICSHLALIHQHGAFGVWISIVFFPVAGRASTQAISSLLLVLVSNENCRYLCNKTLQESFSPVNSSPNAFLVKGMDMWVPYLCPPTPPPPLPPTENWRENFEFDDTVCSFSLNKNFPRI